MRSRWLMAPILATICAAYANHFHNSFHFDDTHAIIDNPAIRSVRNIPEFFIDATAFSVLPANRTWRPLVSTSLAVDYWIGRGLNPMAFHVSTFVWFLLLVWILFLLANRIFDSARAGANSIAGVGSKATTLAVQEALVRVSDHPACPEFAGLFRIYGGGHWKAARRGP
jgi:hypothetical protein